VVRTLEDRHIGAANPAMGFPMEMDRFPGKVWVVSHKPVAVAAGLGMMGIHRNVIHEKFGNFILLGTILLDAEVSESSQPIDYNPCLECKLCVAACPVGAISPEGDFNFSACYTHNYREFMGGFTDWVEQVADSSSARDYRGRVSDAESASMWQSLSFGANYKAAYCLAVCPAGEDVIGPFLADRKAHLKDVVRPLQEKEETIYVTKNSDAEVSVAKRFPHKKIKHVGNSLRPNTIEVFLKGMRNVFQPGKSAGLNATFHPLFFSPLGRGREREGRAAAGNGRDSAAEDQRERRACRPARSARYRGLANVARLSAEGKKRSVGATAAEDSARWPTQVARGVRQVLSAVTSLNL
jgi:NAD-dependent dihydropyrimidine dehydrogenase PreA subunit